MLLNVPDGRPAGAAAVPFVLWRAEIPERTGVTGHINMSAYRFARAGQTTRRPHVMLDVLREGGGINLHYHEGIDADHAYYLSEGRVEAQVAGRTYREIGPHSLMVFERRSRTASASWAQGARVSCGWARARRVGPRGKAPALAVRRVVHGSPHRVTVRSASRGSAGRGMHDGAAARRCRIGRPAEGV